MLLEMGFFAGLVLPFFERLLQILRFVGFDRRRQNRMLVRRAPEQEETKMLSQNARNQWLPI